MLGTDLFFFFNDLDLFAMFWIFLGIVLDLFGMIWIFWNDLIFFGTISYFGLVFRWNFPECFGRFLFFWGEVSQCFGMFLNVLGMLWKCFEFSRMKGCQDKAICLNSSPVE